MWDRLSAKIGSILRRENDPPKVGLEARIGNTDLQPLKVEHSVAPSDVKVAQGHLRMMEVEREILSHAIRRLYEAEADGKINKGELKGLLSRYKERMVQVKNTIQHDQSVVALYELECIQDDLIGLLNKHYNDLKKKIGELKARLGMEPAPTPPSKEKKEKRRKRRKKKRSSAAEKSEVEERIEKIRAEVD
ncbi:MAG: hypothetical protein ACE5OW_08260, partial [Candidatus Bathyarchaeia archaeon]